MPQGDAQRAWFPEMLEELKTKWNPSLSWDDYIAFCNEATEYRKTLRKEKGITGPRMWCSNCESYHDMGPPDVGVRSMLFALKKINLLADEEFNQTDREWKNYQRHNKLTATGKKKSEEQNKSPHIK